MKPLNANNNDGRVLLALRAGAMTSGEFSERGLSVSGWLIKEGLVVQVDGAWRITEAGRKACPLRNPLLAKPTVTSDEKQCSKCNEWFPADKEFFYRDAGEKDGLRSICKVCYADTPSIVRRNEQRQKEIHPSIQSEISMEKTMSETKLSRQQVLDAIKEAGPAGINKSVLLSKLGHLAPEAAITSHLVVLKKNGAIDNPSRGLWVAAGLEKEPPRKVVQSATGMATHATRETVMAWLENQSEGVESTVWRIAHGLGCTEESTDAVLAGLYAGLKVDRRKMGDEWAYFIGKPAMEAQHEAAEACGEQSAESETQPALPLTDEPQAPAAAQCAEHLLSNSDYLAIKIPTPVEEIEVKAVPDRRAPILIEKEGDFEVGIFSNGTMAIQIEDGVHDTVIMLSSASVIKLRRFLGLFQEAV